ncbi:MAG: hypothetical protein ACYCSO_06945 [Cuniculiplasma sp.]
MQISTQFDWEKIRIESNKERKLSVPGLILLILNIGPIKGKTKLQKEVFLAWSEIFGGGLATDPIFHPDQFGPFSQIVVDSQTLLASEHKIKVIPKGEGHRSYFISQEGKKALNEELKNSDISDKLLRNLEERKADWDEWTAQGIMRYIYRNYPYYGIKARIKELKWE